MENHAPSTVQVPFGEDYPQRPWRPALWHVARVLATQLAAAIPALPKDLAIVAIVATGGLGIGSVHLDLEHRLRGAM